jgi:hypothetical protein
MRINPHRFVSNVLFALTAGLPWFARPPRSPMITTLGLPGPSAAEGRVCRFGLRRLWYGRALTREVMCSRRFDPERPAFVATVFYDALSRRMLSANVGFRELDSVTVYALADSIAGTLDARGGRRIGCAPVDAVVLDVQRAYLWRFPGFDVRLFVQSPLPPRDDRDRAQWFVAVIALPSDAPDCSFVRRLHNN